MLPKLLSKVNPALQGRPCFLPRGSPLSCTNVMFQMNTVPEYHAPPSDTPALTPHPR